MPLPKVFEHECDVLVVGAGGAGLRAAVELAERGFRTCVVSKVYPMRSHTGAAQGGINAALDSYGDGDTWQAHARDTVRGGDWLCDQDAVHLLCARAPHAVVDLEHRGAPFSRTPAGRIYQRRFGGGRARRACACADRTGHAILHTLYGDALRARTLMHPEFFALDLLRTSQASGSSSSNTSISSGSSSENNNKNKNNNENEICGALCYSMQDGTYHSFHATHTLLATGGAGRCYRTTTAGYPCTGDGAGLALRAGVPVEDMEFVQFHPTGVHGCGTLISEAVRGEGGFLVNGAGERFMRRYAPGSADLAPRDVVARAIAREIAAGRGCGPRRDHVLLQLHHLPARVVRERLPGIADIARLLAGVDVTRQPIPVAPTVHYTMGGVPTDVHGHVIVPEMGDSSSASTSSTRQVPVRGLYAAGEAACASVHGANRLGANSLLETVVFGTEVARTVAREGRPGTRAPPADPELIARIVGRVEALLQGSRSNRGSHSSNNMSLAEVRAAMRETMERDVGVFRTRAGLQRGCATLEALYRDALPRVRLHDGARVMNTNLTERLELENMLLQCLAAAHSALAREESRGAHARDDFPHRDDRAWLRHTLAWVDPASGRTTLAYKPVRLATLDPAALPSFLPEERKY